MVLFEPTENKINTTVESGRRTTPKLNLKIDYVNYAMQNLLKMKCIFISECELYSKIRRDFLEKYYNLFPNIRLLNMRDKFRFLFSSENPLS